MTTSSEDPQQPEEEQSLTGSVDSTHHRSQTTTHRRRAHQGQTSSVFGRLDEFLFSGPKWHIGVGLGIVIIILLAILEIVFVVSSALNALDKAVVGAYIQLKTTLIHISVSRPLLVSVSLFASMFLALIFFVFLAIVLYYDYKKQSKLEEEITELKAKLKQTATVPPIPKIQLATEGQPSLDASPPPIKRLSIQSPAPIAKVEAARMEDKPAKDPDGYEREEAEHPHRRHFPGANEEINILQTGWSIIGASRRGQGHEVDGKYREDDFSIRLVGMPVQPQKNHPRLFKKNAPLPPIKDSVLICIADGVSTRPWSRYGARAAVLGVTNEQFAASLQHLKDMIYDSKNVKEEECEQFAKNLLMQTLQKSQEEVRNRAKQAQITVDDMHSTILAFLAIPYGPDPHSLFVASVQVGDGALYIRKRGDGSSPRSLWEFLQIPQIQESGNEVQPFMRSNQRTWEEEFKCGWYENVEFMMGMTDGTVDDIGSPAPTKTNPDPDPFSNVESFYSYIKAEALSKNKQPVEAANALGEFLGYRKQGSLDDRTVVCLYHLEGGK